MAQQTDLPLFGSQPSLLTKTAVGPAENFSFFSGVKTATTSVMKKSLMLMTLILSSLFSSCFTARVVAQGSPGLTESETGFSLFWGITETKTNAVECQYGLQSVTTYLPWYHYFVYSFTIGIIGPVVKEYTCMAEPNRVAPPPPPQQY